MTNANKHRMPPYLKNVRVTLNSSGAPECYPDKIPSPRYSVLNFYLDPLEVPEDFIFLPKITKVPDGTRQFSQPTVSTDGKMLTISDVDNLRESVNITLYVIDKDQRVMPVDPQIVNEPQPHTTDDAHLHR